METLAEKITRALCVLVIALLVLVVLTTTADVFTVLMAGVMIPDPKNLPAVPDDGKHLIRPASEVIAEMAEKVARYNPPVQPIQQFAGRVPCADGFSFGADGFVVWRGETVICFEATFGLALPLWSVDERKLSEAEFGILLDLPKQFPSEWRIDREGRELRVVRLGKTKHLIPERTPEEHKAAVAKIPRVPQVRVFSHGMSGG